MKSDLMTWDGKQMEAFLAAAEELHFGRAAARLFMTQPPFSQLIRRLERAVGATLFERTTRSVRLTPAGEVMLQRTRRIAAELALTLKAVQQAARGEGGTLTIGLTPTAACSPLAEKLHAYRMAHPEVTLDLQEMNSNLMEGALRLRSMDVALMRPMPVDADIEVTAVFDEPMLLAVRRDDPLARRKSVRLQEVAERDLVGYAQAFSPYFRKMLQAMFIAVGRKPRVVQESVIPTLLTLVEAGIGVAIVPWSISRSRGEGLVFLPLADAAMPRASIVSASLAERANPAVDGFTAAMQGLQQPL